MRLERRFEFILIVFFAFFSWWLMNKSFGYDSSTHQIRIARNEVGDFGLHLSLIRSFSLGSNLPPQLPFFPGRSLPYHYYFDFLVGFMERMGLRIDLAMNGLSVVAFTVLLWCIYKLPQILFFKSKFIGVMSVFLFLFHSGVTFIDFFKKQSFSFELFKNLWYLPDYIHKGPFDGSLISIFFTLNVFLNQRHLVIALAISLAMLCFLMPLLLSGSTVNRKTLVGLGLLLGVSSGIHTLIFFANIMVFAILFVFFNRKKWIIPFFLSAFLFSIPHITTLLQLNAGVISHNFVNPGFLSSRPLTISGLFQFWFLNVGVAFVLIPLGVLLANQKQRFFFLCFFLLFLAANTFQFSFRVDHNHSLINYFLIIANFYLAYYLNLIFEKNLFCKIITLVLLFLLFSSGFIDLMAIKNDYQVTFYDVPSNNFMHWIKESTSKNAIFLAHQDVLDPITLSGRRNYYGSTYYLSVMGYDYSKRRSFVSSFFEVNSVKTIQEMKKEGIAYVVLPTKPIADFDYSYNVDKDFLKSHLSNVYSDSHVIVYKL